MFDVAIYTDTRADEAIDGIDGFNFQAVSEGITAQDRQIIRDYMLHRVVVGWGTDNNPLDHPPTFVYYFHSGRYYLARGISTGVTNNGRPGNLLTQAIVTSDPEDFGQMRPAQLFGAVNWRFEKAAAKSIEQWAAPLEVSPEFEATALCQMVKEDPWASQRLPSLLTMVEQVAGEDGKRLIIVCSDPVLAERWIALATLFFDARKALELVIRGVVPDPMMTKGDVVSASPAFGQQPDPLTPRAGVNIVDLDEKRVSAVEPSPSANTHARWFLEEDSTEALAAIDLARRWEQFLGRDLATNAAAIVSFPREQGGPEQWKTAMQALRGLADNRQPDELFFYGDALLDSAVTHAPSSAQEAEIAAQALMALVAAGCHDLACSVLLPALEAITALPSAADAWLEAATAAADGLGLQWEDEEARDQASIYASQLSTDVRSDMLPALFSVIRTLQVPLSQAAIQPAAERLAVLWSSTPTLTSQYSRWAYSPEIVAQLMRALVASWTRGDESALQQLVGETWSWLEKVRPDASLREPLAEWFSAAAIARTPVDKRAARFSYASPLPPESWTITWAGVSLPSDSDVILNYVDNQGILASGAARWLNSQFRRVLLDGKSAVKARDLLLRLAQPDVSVPDTSLASLAADTAKAVTYCTAARKSKEVPNPYLRPVATYLPRLAALLVDHLGELILTSPDAPGIAHLVTASGNWAETGTLAALKRRRDTEAHMVDALKRSLTLLEGPLDGPAQAAHDFLLSLSDNRQNMSLVAVAEENLDRRTRSKLEDFMKDAKRGRLKRRLSRATADLLGSKEKGS